MSDPTNPDPPAAFDGSHAESRVERVADSVMNTVVPGYDEKVKDILSDMDAESAADKTMLEKEEQLMAERPAAEAAGVDISAIQAADPTFDDQGFLTIARECYERVREARGKDDPQFTDAELSPELERQLKDVIAGDVASHRHHLLPGLEIRTAVIESAVVADTKMTIVVQLHLQAEEVDVDGSNKVVAGDYTQHEWDENWTFWRDTSVDATDLDKALTLVPIDAGGWLVAHRGWIVTAVERVGAPDPLDPTNL